MSRNPVLPGVAVLCVLGLAGSAAAASRGPSRGVANPSALIATEVAESQLAVRKGHAKALRAFAQDDAAPIQPLAGKRTATHVWISCDGTLGVTQGAVTGPGGPLGAYVTVWRRQKNGTYRWVLDQAEARAPASEDMDMITAKVAACTSRVGPPTGAADKALVVTAPLVNGASGGASDDGTLAWSARAELPCARIVAVRAAQQTGADPVATMALVLNARFAPPGCGA